SYNGHYLSFPSPNALIKTTIHARSHVTISRDSTKNHCSCGVHGDASFHASANLKKLLSYREIEPGFSSAQAIPRWKLLE
ncbi:hypothetical protein, partial [Burkholderia multivorans]|uniref:hypothetical protein n=1 Tax=Burkholderia multivorans TaxID=87883 RepID=UPI0019552A4D